MRIPSRILLLIGGISAFVQAALLFIYGVVFGVLSLPVFKDLIMKGIEDGTIKVEGADSVNMALTIVQITFVSVAVIFLILAGLSIASGILTFKARKEEEKVSYILAIVFGALSDVTAAVVGSVFGLFYIHHKKKEEDEVIDATSK